MAQSEYDQLAQALPHDLYLAQCGAYQCAARMVDLVDTLIEKAATQRERTNAIDTSRRDHRNAITYASHLWK